MPQSQLHARSRWTMILGAAVLAMTIVQTAHGQWPQWGGPEQDFNAGRPGIAKSWPETGPRQLWSRELGDGYSGILVDGKHLYTMYRANDKEVVACLDASNGKSVWEHAYASKPIEGHVSEFGEGPRATPLLADGRLYTAGVSGMMHCLDQQTGKVHWSHDLLQEFGGSKLPHGYSSNPIIYGDTIITLVGGEGASVVAFNKSDGSVKWKKHSFKNSYSTPKIYKVAGKDQLITFMAQEVVGLDPKSGDLLWQFEHGNRWGQNICIPVWHDDTLFISSSEAGSRGLKLIPDGNKFKVEELWSTRKIQFYHVTRVRGGDWVYGSSGTRACFISSINVKDGKIGWRERGFAKANVLGVDGRLIILDEDGNLALASATPEALTVHSKFKLFEDVSWTVPTLVGKTLYARNKKKLVALDLG